MLEEALDRTLRARTDGTAAIAMLPARIRALPRAIQWLPQRNLSKLACTGRREETAAKWHICNRATGRARSSWPRGSSSNAPPIFSRAGAGVLPVNVISDHFNGFQDFVTQVHEPGLEQRLLRIDHDINGKIVR